MAAALPAAKLAVLFLKVLTKPLSNMVKARAATVRVLPPSLLTVYCELFETNIPFTPPHTPIIT